MASTTVVMRASVRGARAKGHELRGFAREIQTIMLEEFRGQVAPGAKRIYRAHAPRSRLMRVKPDAKRLGPLHRSGELQRGIEATVRSYGGRITATVTSSARSADGYDYLGVTRYGHKVAFITPKRAKALAIPVVGGVIFRRRVRGYRPAKDWAEAAFAECDALLKDVEAHIGRAIDARLA